LLWENLGEIPSLPVALILQGADVKINNVKKLTDYKYLNLFSVNYKDRAKCDKQWTFASRSKRLDPLAKKNTNPDAVVIVPFHVQEQKLVVIKEFRISLGGYHYGFPAGLLDKNESIETAGKRELYEETGLSITKILKKSPAVFSSSGMTDESVSLLFVECNGEPTNRFNEASEDIEVKMLSKKNAADLLSDNKIKFDVKSWIVLNTFASYGVI
jgi:ADP-ribose pyrophosphatase